MTILIGVIWTSLSITAIAIDDRITCWTALYKIWKISTILALLYNGWQLYDPAQTIMIGFIDINPTWNNAILLSLLEGACITGPIAAIHAVQDYLYYEHNININPIRKVK